MYSLLSERPYKQHLPERQSILLVTFRQLIGPNITRSVTDHDATGHLHNVSQRTRTSCTRMHCRGVDNFVQLGGWA